MALLLLLKGGVFESSDERVPSLNCGPCSLFVVGPFGSLGCALCILFVIELDHVAPLGLCVKFGCMPFYSVAGPFWLFVLCSFLFE